MALLRCPGCRQNINSRDTACPNCGYPVDAVIRRVKLEVAQEAEVKESVKRAIDHSSRKSPSEDRGAVKYAEPQKSIGTIIGYFAIAVVAGLIAAFVIWVIFEAREVQREVGQLQSRISEEKQNSASEDSKTSVS